MQAQKQSATRVDAILFLNKMCHAYQEKLINNPEHLNLDALEQNIGKLFDFLFQETANDHLALRKYYLQKLSRFTAINSSELTTKILNSVNSKNTNELKQNFFKALKNKTKIQQCGLHKLLNNALEFEQDKWQEKILPPQWILTENKLYFFYEKNKKPKPIPLNETSFKLLNEKFKSTIEQLEVNDLTLITTTASYDPNNPISVLFDFFIDAIQEYNTIALESNRKHYKLVLQEEKPSLTLILGNPQDVQKINIQPINEEDGKQEAEDTDITPITHQNKEEPVYISKNKRKNGSLTFIYKNKSYEINSNEIEKLIQDAPILNPIFIHNAVDLNQPSLQMRIQSPKKDDADFNIAHIPEEKCWYFSKNGHHIKLQAGINNLNTLTSNAKPLNPLTCGLVSVSIEQEPRDVHILSELPKNLDQYKKSYIFIKGTSDKTLYYIMPNGKEREERNIEKEQFENKLKDCSSENSNKITLTSNQVREAIYSNGGIKPNISFETIKNDIQNQDAIVLIDDALYFARYEQKTLKKIDETKHNSEIYQKIKKCCSETYRAANEEELNDIAMLCKIVQKFQYEEDAYKIFLKAEIKAALFDENILDIERIQWLNFFMPDIIHEQRQTEIANASIEMAENFQNALNKPISEEQLKEYNQFKAKLNETMPCLLVKSNQNAIERINALPKQPAYYWDDASGAVYYHSLYSQNPIKIIENATNSQIELINQYLGENQRVELNETQHQQLSSMLFHSKPVLPKNNTIHKAFSEATQTLNTSLNERYIDKDEQEFLVQHLNQAFFEKNKINLDPNLTKVISNIPDFSSLYSFNTESFPYLYENNYNQYFEHCLQRNRDKLPTLLDFIALTIKASDTINHIQNTIKNDDTKESKKIIQLLERIKIYNVFLAKLSLPLSELIKNIKLWNEEAPKENQLAYDHISALMAQFNDGALNINEFRRIYEFHTQVITCLNKKQNVNFDIEPFKTLNDIKQLFDNSSKQKLNEFNKENFKNKLKTHLDQAFLHVNQNNVQEIAVLKAIGSYYFPREQFELKAQLNRYIFRVESHKKNGNIDFADGFTFFSKVRAAHREANYNLAKQALQQIENIEKDNQKFNPGESIKTLFSQGKFAPKKISSKELKTAFQFGANLK